MSIAWTGKQISLKRLSLWGDPFLTEMCSVIRVGPS